MKANLHSFTANRGTFHCAPVRQLRYLIVFLAFIFYTSTSFCQVFEEHLVADSLSWIKDISSVDLDNDGDIDILGCEGEGAGKINLHWWENTGEGEFVHHRIASDFWMLQGITPVDFDNDSDIDILLAGGEDYDRFTVLENTGDLEFEHHVINTNFDEYGAPYVIQAANIGGDDRLDIVVAFSIMDRGGWFQGGLKVFIQTEPYTFRDSTLVEYGSYGWQCLFLLNLDEDEDIDIISSEYGEAREVDLDFGWWENNNGNFEYFPLPFIGRATVKMIDLNQDGLLDIVRCQDGSNDWSNVFWHKNLGNLEFEQHDLPGNPQPIIWDAAIADYDLDGDLDIVTSQIGLVLMENNGEEDFESRFVNRSNIYLNVLASDINGDGRMDLVANDNAGLNTDGKIYWFENREEQAVPFIEDEKTPLNFELFSVCPNPFNSSTKVSYSIPHPGNLSINLYDIQGRSINQEVITVSQAGRFSKVFDLSDYPTGVYFLEMTFDSIVKRQKLVLIR